MKVLIGTALGMGAGGVRTHIESLKHALSSKGIYTELVYPDCVKSWWKIAAALRALGSIDRARVELTKIRTNNVWMKVQDAIKREKFDLIHTHDVLLASWVELKLQMPVVLTVHGPLSREAIMLGKGSPTYLDYLKEIEQQAYRSVNAIIAVDSGQKDIIVSDYNIPPEKICVIHNAVDTDMFAPRSIKKTDETPFFLVPRRLVPKNGVRVAIEAFQFLRDTKVELWIAGDGPERAGLEKLVAENNLREKVRFLGSVDKKDMVFLMNASIGIIIPSVPVEGVIEATSIAALEGMSVGKPVFASNIGGLAEIIRDGDTGLLFEAGNYKALGILLRRALIDKESMESIGRNARQYVVNNYSLEVWVQKILRVYHHVA